MHVVDFTGHVRTLNVLGHVLGLAVHVLVHDTPVTSATTRAMEEGGRGAFGQFLLPPLLLFPPPSHLVVAGPCVGSCVLLCVLYVVCCVLCGVVCGVRLLYRTGFITPES